MATSKPSIVVTGAFGYLGARLVQRLAEDYVVTAVGHPPRAELPIPSSVRIVHGDATAAIGYLTGETHALVHLAGGGGTARCLAAPDAAVRNIVRVAIDLAAAAAAAGSPRLVFASTIAVYGTWRDVDRPYTEKDETVPDEIYGALKEAAESIWTRFGGGTALRLANIYGAGVGIDLGVQGVMERFARAAAKGEELTVYGDGSQAIDLVHIEDVVEAIRGTLQAKELPPVLNIGSGRVYEIRELAAASLAAGRDLGMRPELIYKTAPADKVWPTRSLDISLARQCIDWQPRVSLQRGVAELVRTLLPAPTPV